MHGVFDLVFCRIIVALWPTSRRRTHVFFGDFVASWKAFLSKKDQRKIMES